MGFSEVVGSPKVDRVPLELLKVMAQDFLSGHSLATMKIERVDADLGVVFRLSTQIASEIVGVTEKGVEVSFEGSVPIKRYSGWWSHFRKSVFPKFLLGWFPPEYKSDSCPFSGVRYVPIKLLEKFPKFPIVFLEAGESFSHIDCHVTCTEESKWPAATDDRVPKIEVTVGDCSKSVAGH